MDSDAHFDLLIGEFDLARDLLTKLDFPEELVLNRSVESVKRCREPEAINVEIILRNGK